MKPTPGPWTADIEIIPPMREFHIYSRDHRTVARYLAYDDYKHEALNTALPIEVKANAYLLAASWDLYDGCNALLGLLQLIRYRDDVSHELAEIIRTSNRVNAVEQAVVKAQKGE